MNVERDLQAGPERRAREARTESLAVRYTKDEVALLSGAAEREGQPIREWMRDCLLAAADRQAAGRQIDDPLLCEILALRFTTDAMLRYVAAHFGMTPETITAIHSVATRDKRQLARVALEQYSAVQS